MKYDWLFWIVLKSNLDLILEDLICGDLILKRLIFKTLIIKKN